MGMTSIVYEMKENMNHIMTAFKRKLGEEMFNADGIDTELVELTQGLFKMCDLSMKLMEQQAETMERMDDKLNTIVDEILRSKG
jgi:hypothetical protein